MKRIEEDSGWYRWIACHRDMDVSAGHRARNSIPNLRADAWCFIRDDEEVFSMIALKVLGLVG